MKIQMIIKFPPKFIKCSLNDLLNKKDISYTGFYAPENDGNNYYFKIGKDFYIVKAKRYEELEKAIVDKMNYDEQEKRKHRIIITSINGKKRHNIGIANHSNIGRTYMGIYDLMNLYTHNNNIKVSECFYTTGTDQIHGTYADFLKTVKNVLLIKQELDDNNIKEPYRIMKYIYDKYKMEASYWDPGANYGEISGANTKLSDDQNRIIRHPFDYLGLINDKYATCEGMANGLVELYRYFGIDASLVKRNDEYVKHGMCKINLRNANGESRVTYVDLSREVTSGFQDNKYEYINGNAIPRRVSNRIATPNSYNFFMKANAGKYINDSDLSIAVDYKPQMKIYFNNDDELRDSNRR